MQEGHGDLKIFSQYISKPRKLLFFTRENGSFCRKNTLSSNTFQFSSAANVLCLDCSFSSPTSSSCKCCSSSRSCRIRAQRSIDIPTGVNVSQVHFPHMQFQDSLSQKSSRPFPRSSHHRPGLLKLLAAWPGNTFMVKSGHLEESFLLPPSSSAFRPLPFQIILTFCRQLSPCTFSHRRVCIFVEINFI